MALITFNIEDHTSLGLKPNIGHVVFTPTQIHTHGNGVGTARPFTVKYDKTFTQELESTSAEWLWKISINSPDPIIVGYYPITSDADFKTLLQTEPDDSWWMKLNQLISMGGGPAGKDGKDGKDGVNGKLTTLVGGTVTKLPPGAQPTAEVVGTLTSKVLDLGLVTGDPGKDGSNVLPTNTAIAQAIREPGEAKNELSAAIGEAIAASGPGALVSVPVGMSMGTLNIPPITRLGAGRFRAALDLEAMRPAPGVTYYVAPTGTDAADGLTAATPTTIKAAVAKADVGTIMYAPGEYMRNEHFLSTITGKSINHLASGPGVKITGWNNPGSTVWTLVSGSIYKTSRSATNGVVDVINRSEWGDYTEYAQKADLASITGPGQWAIVGSDVYVWAIGNTDFTVIANRYQIRLAMSGVTVGIPVSGGVHYVRGINYERTQISAISGALVIAEDVTVKHSLVDGVYANGVGTGFIGNRVTVSSTGADGLSYTAGAEFIEIDCKAHHCGTSAGSTTNNATTSHVGTKGIRLNGVYDVSGGPVVADVNDAKTWSLGCSSGGSTAPESQNQSWRVDAVGYEATPATMWLDECTARDATNAYKATGGGRLYLHATSESNLNATDSSSVGTIAYYDA